MVNKNNERYITYSLISLLDTGEGKIFDEQFYSFLIFPGLFVSIFGPILIIFDLILPLFLLWAIPNVF